MAMAAEAIPGMLTARIAVVTGGRRGIGAAIARALAARGARIAIVDLHDADETVDAIAAAGGEARAFRADVSDEDQVGAVRDAVHAAFGPIDILVNDAAVNHNGGFEETDAATYHRVLGINLHSQFHLCKAFVPDMRAKRAGRIINLSSGTALSPGGPPLFAYRVSKAGILGLTFALAGELGEHGITVNAVAPGFTHTPAVDEAIARGDFPPDIVEAMTAHQLIKRPSRPEDVAALVAFLASDEAGFITGKFITADGGSALAP